MKPSFAVALVLLWLPSIARPAAVATTILQDVHYGDDALQAMDVYQPVRQGDAPVIVMVHGGAWRIGDKKNSAVVKNKVNRWVARGFVFVSVNYRMLPQAAVNEQASDIARAIVFIQKRAGEWGGDPARLVLMGHSAGAHLVSMLASSPAPVLAMGGHLWLGTIAIDSAAFNIVELMQARHYRFYDTAFGSDPEYWKRVSPFHLLTQTRMPLLAICSSRRRDKPCLQAQAYAKKAATMDVQVDVLPVALTHRQANERLGDDEVYTGLVESFMGSLDPAVAQRLVPPVR